MVSYDDATSFGMFSSRTAFSDLDSRFKAAKGTFINAQGLLGFAVWDVTGDYNDILLDSLHEAMGIEQVCDS
jgi:chitinase